MSTDLDQQLTATLAARAGTDADLAPIIDAARRRGIRLRRRRQVVTAAAVCAVLGVSGFLLTGTRTAPPLPPAGVPGAAQRPDLIGTDAGVLHFTADDLVAGANRVVLNSERDLEWVSTGLAEVYVSRDRDRAGNQSRLASLNQPGPPEDVVVRDRPATAVADPAPGAEPPVWTIRWQPADGFWAVLRMHTSVRDEAVSAASRVRFDRSRACAVPFRLTSVPAGAERLSCTVGLDREGRYADGQIDVGDAFRSVTVRSQHVPVGLSGPDRRIRPQGADVLEMTARPFKVEARFDRWDAATGRALLEGYQPAGDLDDPRTWAVAGR